MKKIILALSMFVVILQANAQITTTICPNGEGFKEFPMLYKVNAEDIPIYKMPRFNLDSVLQYEDDLDEKGVGRPYRFGYTFDTDYKMEHGKWIKLEDKSIWSIRFRSEKAYTLNFRFADLKLPYNAELYVYNSNGTIVDGPYTYRNNTDEEFRTIGSDLIDGEEVVIQIIEPKEAKQSSSVKIVRVVHGFRDNYKEILPNKDKKNDKFQAQVATLSCHNDVMCYPEYENLARGVARLLVGDWAFCSGALLNNVRGNNRPYLLTAFHCADNDSNAVLSPAEINDAGIWSFQFNYKKSSCNSTNTVWYVKRYNGADFRAGWKDSDFLLLELKEAVTDTNIRFLGWDVLPQDVSYHNPVVGIHHPNGDLMKISLRTGWVFTNGDHFHSKGLKYPRDHFWNVIFNNGAVEKGSSGSPLFRRYTNTGDEYRVIGQFGFMNEAICPPDQLAKYGTLAKSRDGGGTPDTRLSDWLYPDGYFQSDINSATPSQSFTLENKTLTNYERIVSKNILLQNITINSGATLLLQATESITLGHNVVVKTGGTLITEGRLLINSPYTVEAGASVIIK